MTGDEYFLFSDFSDFSNIFEITEKAEARICETAVCCHVVQCLKKRRVLFTVCYLNNVMKHSQKLQLSYSEQRRTASSIKIIFKCAHRRHRADSCRHQLLEASADGNASP